MPTDTIYGLVGSAFNKRAVERIYRVRKRSPQKPCIVLIASPRELRRFGVIPNPWQKKQTKKFWPGPASIIFPVSSKKFRYLHRGTKTLAFRVPGKPFLRKLLTKTGPLIAPSANPEGLPPARNSTEARKYFGEKINFYISGKIAKRSSKLLKLSEKSSEILRP